ncbi:MAG: hypothetical protein IKC59_04130 [Clostridia bacterium]|nr:hypothetical protein [Clostridia bacterium]
MAGTVVVRETADLVGEVYRNVKMAEESILDLMPKVKDETLKSALTVQLSVYSGFAARAAKLLGDEGATPDDGGVMAKMGAKWGIMMNTMKDCTTEHLIQMMIEGTTMGVGELLRWIRESENTGVSEASLKLAREVCTYEEKTVEDLKEMLKK